ncbi:2-dehydro-3-deoxy-6-phosphogalactonate aldolase [Kordiimonas sp. SCSIO 12603]|nr:2-dehydro-3-deoxy-6-phosphogalactonate aldolase [Kordiimonas sp. SCSIO 12603]UTW58944.1 2-dehydro-3-deoxy-6-phosphogalactonate aldolase [Kordiimonas sp. SCSIO 12603]
MNSAETYLKEMPLVAILRGIKPDEVVAIGSELINAGFKAIEVPLNSPDPLESIKRLVNAFGSKCLIGAGTVLTPDAVEAVDGAGGKLIVTPNTDPNVIEKAVSLGLLPMPGMATATEALTAVKAGATHLKLFPAGTYGKGHIGALKAVLPINTKIYAVGGVSPDNLAEWLSAGADGVGFASNLYKPGLTAADVAENAKHMITAYKTAQ